MPKEPKRKPSAKTGHSTRHAPLGQVIQDDANRGKYATMKKLSTHDDEEEETDELLDAKTSKKILELSRVQQREMREEEERGLLGRRGKEKVVVDDSSDEEESHEEEYEDDDDLVQHDEGYVTMSTNIGLTPEEEALLSNMMGGGGGDMEEEEPQRKTLADIIMEKIEEKEAMANMPDDGEQDLGGLELPAKVIQVSSIVSSCSIEFSLIDVSADCIGK